MNAAPEVGPGRFEPLGPLTLWRPGVDARWPWLEMRVTTRLGGTSPPPYDALNLGQTTGDARQHVEANRALLRRTLGLEAPPWHRLQQVHGNRVLRAGTAAAPEADGLWTDVPGPVLVVSVADCVPVFLWDARRRLVAIVHAGWRGTEAGVVQRGVECFLDAGANTGDVWMAMGPSIGPCCYAVGPEVAAPLAEAVVPSPDGRPHLDLRRANRLRALALGVPQAQILGDPPCTACDGRRFYSHRKLGPRTGRQWALAWMRP